jgi:hypothetical protein
MKHTLLLLVLVSITASATAWSAGEGATRTLNGEYLWSDRGSRGDLEAVFTPTAEGRWDVAFHFTFRGRSHVFSGTAEGSISKGALSGEVQNESKPRTFTFDGEFKNGKFKGSHAEIGGDRKQRTGTLTLDD